MPKPGDMRAGHFRTRILDPAWRYAYGPLARLVGSAAAMIVISTKKSFAFKMSIVFLEAIWFFILIFRSFSRLLKLKRTK